MAISTKVIGRSLAAVGIVVFGLALSASLSTDSAAIPLGGAPTRVLARQVAAARQRLGGKLGNLGPRSRPERRRVRTAGRNHAARTGRPRMAASCWAGIIRSRRFPLLLKFLDGQQTLSVQVHPDDARAARLDPPDAGKTEAWLVVEALPGSMIYAGLKPGVDRDRLAGGDPRGDVRAMPERLRGVAGRLRFRARRNGSRPRRRSAGGRNPAVERHDLPAVRLEPRWARRPAAAAAHRARARRSSISLAARSCRNVRRRPIGRK